MAVLYLLLFCATWYIAAMYHAGIWMVLAVMELIWLLTGICVTWRWKDRLCVSLAVNKRECVKGCSFPVTVRTNSDSPIPYGRLEVKVKTWYGNGQKKKNGMQTNRTTCIYKSVLKSGVRKQEESTLQVCPPYCGLWTVRLEKMKLYDALALVASGKRLSEQVEVAVFPAEVPLHLDGIVEERGTYIGSSMSLRLQETGMDVRQLRAYSPGDGGSRIHWKLSARTDTLWVREREGEVEGMTVLTFSLGHLYGKDPEKRSVFYETLSGMLLGLLQHFMEVEVRWGMSETSQMESKSIVDSGTVRELLYLAYQKIQEGRMEKLVESDEKENICMDGFYLSGDGNLYANGKWIQNGTV